MSETREAREIAIDMVAALYDDDEAAIVFPKDGSINRSVVLLTALIEADRKRVREEVERLKAREQRRKDILNGDIP